MRHPTRNTLAIHWINTTHGTGLHGSPAGSWHEGRLIGPDPFLEDAVRARMTHDAVVLDPVEMRMVAVDFACVIKERGYRVLAATMGPTHVHLVFAPLPEDVKLALAALKRRSAASVLAVRRKRGIPCGRHLWTQGQFPVFIFTEEHLGNAIEYVRRHNLLVGLPADPYDWIEPLYPPGEAVTDPARMTGLYKKIRDKKIRGR